MAGKYFEELEPGSIWHHQPHRTITETDNLLFSTMTHKPQPLHIDREFAANSIHGQIIVNSLFTLGLLVGLSVGETTLGTTLGNLGMDKVEFPNPLYIGDTLRAETRVIDRRESRSKHDRGIVIFEHTAYKQDGTVVARCERKAMMLKRPAEEGSDGQTA